MQHSLGEEALRVWYLGWRMESAYPPQRVYYRVRNYLRLCAIPGIKWRWKLRHGWYTLGVVYTQVVFGREARRVLGAAARGISDGIRGRMGSRRM